MKELPVFTLPYSVAKAGISNNLPLYFGKSNKTKFQIFIELAFGLWCCMMFIQAVKSIAGINDMMFYFLGLQLWFFYLADYTIFNQHQSRL